MPTAQIFRPAESYTDEFSDESRADRVSRWINRDGVAVEQLWAKNAKPPKWRDASTPGAWPGSKPAPRNSLAANPRGPAVIPASAAAASGDSKEAAMVQTLSAQLSEQKETIRELVNDLGNAQAIVEQ